MQHPRVRLGEHCQCELCTMTQTMLPAAMIRIGTPSLFCPGRLEKAQVIEALQGVLHNEGISARSREPNVSTEYVRGRRGRVTGSDSALAQAVATVPQLGNEIRSA